MSRHKKDPLRILTNEEREWLERISRSRSEPGTHVDRARKILFAPAQPSHPVTNELGRTVTCRLHRDDECTGS